MSAAAVPDTLRPALAALDRRLDPESRAPLAVGLSGGSDSLALLVLGLCWAAARGRRVLALTVDHQLQPDSAVWTESAGETAHRLGADWRALAWTGPKPVTGLPQAARRARHTLLAGAAREAGATVVLLGHTADDRAESELIRAETPTHGRLAEWAPSPAWPEGRGVFLLRPLLETRRRPLQAWLATSGLSWLDDPANTDLRSARSRARAALSSPFPLDGGRVGVGGEGATSGGDLARRRRLPHLSLQRQRAHPHPRPSPIEGEGSRIMAAGGVELSQARLFATPSPSTVLAKAMLCVGGGARPPSGEAVQRLLDRLRSGDAFTITLAGTRLRAADDHLHLTRETGRTPPPPLSLPPAEAMVFDGRFEVSAAEPGWRVGHLAGHAASLPKVGRERLRALPAEVRPTLPVLLDAAGRARLPAPFGEGPATARSLVAERLRAALGEVACEAEAAAAARRRNAGGGESPVILY